MPSMNIVFDYQIFIRQRYGGISRYFFELITRLCQNQRTKVSLFLGYYINDYGLERYQDCYRHYNGTKQTRCRVNLPFLFLNKILFETFVKKITPDIYHQTYYDYIRTDFPVKRVITVHDMIHEIFPKYFPRCDMTRRKKILSVSNAEGIICVSESTKNDLINYYQISEKKIKVIYHGNSLNICVTSPKIVDCPYILYVGQRNRYKNFNLLLKAFANLKWVKKNFALICFGGGPFNINERKLTTSLNVADKVHYYSGSDEILANLYKHASVFVYPSLYEGFGFPPLEAMHYGCPILVSNSSSMPEVVGQAGTYFNPHSQDDLSYKLDKILSTDELRIKNVKLGFEQVKKFSWEKCVKETFDFYKQL